MKRNPDKPFLLTSQEINTALENEYRQYFIGKLGLPQILDYLDLDLLEIGTTLYKNQKCDIPHMHLRSSEILYILNGIYIVKLIDEGDEFVLHKGDFFVIPPNTAYASKACSNTQTLFIKTGGNDKNPVEITPELKTWLSSFPEVPENY